MSALDRRKFLTLLLSGLLAVAAPAPIFAKDGGDNSGSGGGGGDGSDDDHSGPGGGGDDDHDDDDRDADDNEDRKAASKAVREGSATPLRELLKVVRHKYPGEVVDVRLQRRKGKLLYQVKVLDRRGRMINVRIDAGTRLILPVGGP